MKWSKYNTIFRNDDCWLLYNSVSNSFSEMDEELYDVVSEIKVDPDLFCFSDEYNELYTQLLDNFILVEDDEDIFNYIKFKTNKTRFQSEVLNLTILPTLDCNFRCPYCFEENHEHSYMTPAIMDSIIEYIKSISSLKLVNISWMGGEPLLGMDAIEYITKKIKEQNIELHSSLVTNGYLLTEPIIHRLIECNVKSIQVTIDGLKEKHDQRRILENKQGTFDKIIENIKILSQYKDKIKLSIRVNVDNQNQDNYNKLYSFLTDLLGTHTFIYPGFIEESPYGCSKNSCALDRKAKVNFYLNKMSSNNQHPFLYPSYGSECITVRNINSFVIGPKGELYKCWECIGKSDMIVGNICNERIITNNNLFIRFLTGADFLDNPECKKCKILPICCGGCPIK